MKTIQDLNGSTLVELPYVFQRSKFSGGTLTKTFKGTEAQIRIKEDALINLYWTTKRTPGPLWTLEATISNVDENGNSDGSTTSTADGLVVQWELQPNLDEKDLLEALNIPVVRNLPTNYKKYIKDKLVDPDNTSRILAPLITTPAMTNTDHANAQIVWKLLLHGATSVDVIFPVIKRTVTPNINYSLVGYATNENRIFSKATLVTGEDVPTNFAAIMPAYLYPDSSATVTIDGLNYNYGYRKGPTNVQQISLTKNQVSQDWTFGLWSQDVYGSLL